MNRFILFLLFVGLFSCGGNDSSEYEKYLEEDTAHNLKIIKSRTKDIITVVKERGNKGRDYKISLSSDLIHKLTNTFLNDITETNKKEIVISFVDTLNLISEHATGLGYYYYDFKDFNSETNLVVIRNKMSRYSYELINKMARYIGIENYNVSEFKLNYKLEKEHLNLFVETKLDFYSPKVNIGDTTLRLDSNWQLKLPYKEYKGKEIKLIHPNMLTGKDEVISTKVIN